MTNLKQGIITNNTIERIYREAVYYLVFQVFVGVSVATAFRHDVNRVCNDLHSCVHMHSIIASNYSGGPFLDYTSF